MRRQISIHYFRVGVKSAWIQFISSVHNSLQGSAMSRKNFHLKTQNRAVVIIMGKSQCSILSLAKRLCRPPTTISQAIRPAGGDAPYHAGCAHRRRGIPDRADETRRGRGSHTLGEMHDGGRAWRPCCLSICALAQAQWPFVPFPEIAPLVRHLASGEPRTRVPSASALTTRVHAFRLEWYPLGHGAVA
jgi:hypothetical protein